MNINGSNGNGNGKGNGKGTMVRTTIVIPETVDANLGIVAARRGVSKSELFREGAVHVIKNEKLDPTRFPKKVLVEY